MADDDSAAFNLKSVFQIESPNDYLQVEIMRVDKVENAAADDHNTSTTNVEKPICGFRYVICLWHGQRSISTVEMVRLSYLEQS